MLCLCIRLLPHALFLLAIGASRSAPHDTAPAFAALVGQLADSVMPQSRPVDYSDAHYTRLTIHRIGSYVMLPLFGAEYLLGDRLLNSPSPASWIKPTHVGVALGIAALFTSNTITGVWNLWDARHDPHDRGLRYLHAGLLLASDAGFALAPAVIHHGGSANERTLHLNIAIGSMSLATVGTAIMWLRNR